MPMYEYRCQHCKDTFDILARMGEAPVTAECPRDGGEGARVFGAGVAVHTGAASSSADDFDMSDFGGGMDVMGGGHGHDHGHSHDDFGMDDFGMDDF